MQKLGKYEILLELGHGAGGVVYKAHDPSIGRLVALKTINSNLVDRPDLLDRFYQEAHSAGRLHHPNIVTIFELGKDNHTPFIAMEYLDGESLEKHITRQLNDLPLTVRVGYIVQICRALAYAHKNGVVHRDIKPANIMVTFDGTVKVVDFGIARLMDLSRTHTNTMIGTPVYMAPELFRKNKATERSDIWAVGVTFYELICHRRPFTGDSYDLIRSIMEDNFPAPSSIIADCTPDLEAVIRRMLQKRPADRYRSMEDALLHLEPIWSRLQSDSTAFLAQRAREFYELGELTRAQDALRRAHHVDPANKPVKKLLERVTAERRQREASPRVAADPTRDLGSEERRQSNEAMSDQLDTVDYVGTSQVPEKPLVESQILRTAEIQQSPLTAQPHPNPPVVGIPTRGVLSSVPRRNPSVQVSSAPSASQAYAPTSQTEGWMEHGVGEARSVPALFGLRRKPVMWVVAVLLLSMSTWAAYLLLARKGMTAAAPPQEKAAANTESRTVAEAEEKTGPAPNPANSGIGGARVADTNSNQRVAAHKRDGYSAVRPISDQGLLAVAMQDLKDENFAKARDELQELIKRKAPQSSEAKKQLPVAEKALRAVDSIGDDIRKGEFRSAKAKLDSIEQWPQMHALASSALGAAEQQQFDAIRDNAQAVESKGDAPGIQRALDELHGFDGRAEDAGLLNASKELEKKLNTAYSAASEKARDKAAFERAVEHFDQAQQKKDADALAHGVAQEFQKIASGTGMYRAAAVQYVSSTIPAAIQTLKQTAGKVVVPALTCGPGKATPEIPSAGGAATCAQLDASPALQWVGIATVDFPDEAKQPGKLPYTLTVIVTVEQNGNVKVEKGGNPDKAFFNKVKDASKNWKASPPMSNGKPVTVRFPLTLTFQE